MFVITPGRPGIKDEVKGMQGESKKKQNLSHFLDLNYMIEHLLYLFVALMLHNSFGNFQNCPDSYQSFKEIRLIMVAFRK